MVKPDAQRRASFPSSSAENVLANVDKPLKQTGATIVKHGKYVLTGAVGCWYTGLYGVAKSIWTGQTGWIKWVLVASVAAHASTVLIFLYLVFFLPYIRGYIPNYPKWQESARMRVIVPMLTSSILAGWVGYVVALSQAGKRSPLHALGDGVLGLGEGSLERMKGGKGLGIVSSIVGTTSLYIFTLGLLGFIQAPAGTPVRKKQA